MINYGLCYVHIHYVCIMEFKLLGGLHMAHESAVCPELTDVLIRHAIIHDRPL